MTDLHSRREPTGGSRAARIALKVVKFGFIGACVVAGTVFAFVTWWIVTCSTSAAASHCRIG
jgi:hypothetical protein